MSTVVVVHGIHTHGDNGIDRLGKLLEEAGHDVIYFEYPHRFALQLYSKKVRVLDGRALRQSAPEGAHVIAHSYGAEVWINSIKAGAKWGRCFIFSGACTSDQYNYPTDAFKRAYMIYNPADIALWFGALLPFHPFGRLGLRGYSGIYNKEILNVPALKRDNGLNHGYYFNSESLPIWFEYVNNRL